VWAFNAEAVARAIRRSKIPVVTAVGHETDTTVADFAADLRASTPTAAAELVSPDRARLLAQTQRACRSLHQAAGQALAQARARLDALAGSPALGRPLTLLAARQNRLARARDRLAQATAQALEAQRQRLERASTLLETISPLTVLRRGYALVRGEEGPVVTVQDLRPGQRLEITVQDGTFQAEVMEV
jgi:exodeoxyribonuclease VII large subunit